MSILHGCAPEALLAEAVQIVICLVMSILHGSPEALLAKAVRRVLLTLCQRFMIVLLTAALEAARRIL